MTGATGLPVNVWADRGFPHEHLEASRRDARLQTKMRERVERARRASGGVVCPECGDDSTLVWFWFESPPWTWENLCGRAGVVAYCGVHEQQVAYDGYVMN